MLFLFCSELRRRQNGVRLKQLRSTAQKNAAGGQWTGRALPPESGNNAMKTIPMRMMIVFVGCSLLWPSVLAAKATLSPQQVEAAFFRLQKLKLPMPFDDAFRAMGLPPDGEMSVIGASYGSVPSFCYQLTERLPDGGYYTLRVIYVRGSETPKKEAILLRAYFAIEYDAKDKPALVLSQRNFIDLAVLEIQAQENPKPAPAPTPAMVSPAVPPPARQP